jgi:hypothetical protein
MVDEPTDDGPEKPANAAPIGAANAAVAAPADGKARLLTLEEIDRRTAAYRVTKQLISEIETEPRWR